MKKCIRLILTLLSWLFVFGHNSIAQISIVNSDLAQVNDNLRYSISTVNIDYKTTGANYVWDFTQLKPEHQDLEKHPIPLTTPYLLQFLTNSSYGMPEPAENTGLLGNFATNIYSFYKTSSTCLLMVGRGASVQGIPIGIVYLPKDTIYKFPLTYGKQFSGSFSGEQSLATLGSLKQTGTRQTTVDGWGIIKTPYGSFSCLRIKSVVTESDKITVSGLGIPVPNNKTTYTWLAKGEKFPILEVVVGGLANSTVTIHYKDILRPEAYKNNANFRASKTSAKMGDTITLNNSSYGSPKSFSWQISPNTFSYVSGSNSTSENPQVIFKENGMYQVKLTVAYDGANDDTLRSNYIAISEPLKSNFYCDRQIVSPGDTVSIINTSSGLISNYLWTISPNKGVEFINGNNAKDPILVFSQFGNYSVQLKVSNPAASNTSKKDYFIQINPTGIETLLNPEKIKIFPNPGNNFIKVELIDFAPANIKLIDLNGKVVLEKQLENKAESTLVTESLPRGIYLVEIIQGEEKFHSKLFLE